MSNAPATQNPTEPAAGGAPIATGANLHATTSGTLPVSAATGAPAPAIAAQVQDGAKTPDEPEATKADGPPPEYAEFKIPEGVPVDAALLTEFKPLAKALGLTQDKAQSAVDWFAKTMTPHIEQQMAARVEQNIAEWAELTRADPELGGVKYDQNVDLSRKGLAAFASDQLKALFDSSGLGNHPEMVRHFVGLGKLVDEGKLIVGGATDHGLSEADRFYGSN